MRRFAALLLLAVLATAHAGIVNFGSRLRVSEAGDSTITADLQASRTSCTAPCAILFDATATTSTDGTVEPFGEIGSSFRFGADGNGNGVCDGGDTCLSGTFAVSGNSKYFERGGPLAARVFESAGTYVVSLRARDSSGGDHDGDTDQAEVTITVAAADTTYSGTNTICLSRNTDHTGCPAGATQTNNAAFWPSWTSSRRYLLHRGHDFTSLGAIDIKQRNDIQVAAYGSGADPIVSQVDIEVGNPNSTGTTWAERITIADLDISGQVRSGNSHLELLVLRCTTANGVELGGTIGYYYEGDTGVPPVPTMKRLRNTFIVESDISGGDNGNALTAWGRGLVLLGDTLHDPSVEHTSRIWQAYKAVFAHNHYSGAHSGRHHFKMHSSGAQDWDDDVADAEQPATDFVVVANNVIGTGSNVFPFAVGPQNTTVSEPPDEGVRRVLYENNVSEAEYQTELQMGGDRMYERGNSNDVGTWDTSDNYNQVKLPDGWPQSYSHSASAIQTVDPT